MASETDIANSALASIGDTATVAALNPPSGSIQAVHCARFYPIARDALLELHPWGFATKRVSLALLSEAPPSSWAYTYLVPTDVVNFLSVLDPSASDDYSQGLSQYGSVTGASGYNIGVYTPQRYVTEVDSQGNSVIYTNQANAVLVYSAKVTDTTQFSPLFTVGLIKLLASMLAGPVITGAEGRAVASSKEKEFTQWFILASTSDANQRRESPAQSVDWIANR